ESGIGNHKFQPAVKAGERGSSRYHSQGEMVKCADWFARAVERRTSPAREGLSSNVPFCMPSFPPSGWGKKLVMLGKLARLLSRNAKFGCARSVVSKTFGQANPFRFFCSIDVIGT